VHPSHRSDRPADVVLAVPEVRDYHAINIEIVRHLDQGCRLIRLSSVRGQRLLAAGLTGHWSAVVDVEGEAGTELAAGLNAPGLIVICRGGAADGGASQLRAGRIVVLGNVGTAFGYAQSGGLAVAVGNVAGRAGLCQSGGDLVLLANTGPMAGERQSGGRLFAYPDRLGPHPGCGSRGGRFVGLPQDGSTDESRMAPETDLTDLLVQLAPLLPWIGPRLGALGASLSSSTEK
jgi:methylamine---glutamate N-methyltransferase subunit B